MRIPSVLDQLVLESIQFTRCEPGGAAYLTDAKAHI